MFLTEQAKQIGFSLLRRCSAILRGSAEPNCVLLLQAMVPLGGCVHATPLIAALHGQAGALPVVVATHGVGLEVLRHNPNVAVLIDMPDARERFHAAGRMLRRQLRERGLTPAWVLTDLSNPRTRLALLNTVYLHRRLAGFGLTRALQDVSFERDAGQSLLRNNLRLMEVLGGVTEEVEPQVFTNGDATAEARLLLQEVGRDSRGTVIFSTQASGGQPSEWHPERMRTVAEALVGWGLAAVFVGTAQQGAAIDALRGGVGAATSSLAGKTSVPVLAAVLALADLCVSIDTGTMHVARSSGVPLVVLAPTYQEPMEWLPLGLEHVRVLRGPTTGPVIAGYRLDEISVEDALAAASDLLERYPPSERAREARLAAIVSETDHLHVEESGSRLAAGFADGDFAVDNELDFEGGAAGTGADE